LAVGPGYRRKYGDSGAFDVHAAWSLHNARAAEATLSLPELARGRVRLAVQGAWLDVPSVTAYGTGIESSGDSRQTFAYASTRAGAEGRVQLSRRVALGGGLDVVSADAPFTGALAAGSARATYRQQRVFVELDSRAAAGYATRGLVRGFARTPELALREALGGDRGRVGRPLLIEALLLSALGGALGLAAAIWLQGVLSSVPVPPANGTIDIRFDYRMVLFSILAALGTGCLFGLLPSWRSAATNVATALREAGRTQSSGGRSLLRGTLVAAQVALSVVLVVATALLARSFVNAERVDPGVDAERVAVIGTNLLQAGVTPQEAPVVASQILERIGVLPGVEHVALTIRLPLSPGTTSSTIVEGYELPRGTSAIEMPVASVSNDYFATMGIRLLAGRTFSAVDERESPPVVIVNETAARVFFGGDAVGRRVRPQDNPDAWREVVGVVADVKVADLQEPPTPLMYLSTDQTGAGAFSVVVRTSGEPAALLSALPSALRSVRASLPVTRIEAFETHVAAALAAARTTALLMGAFAGLALLLAGLGVYAAVSFSVERRTQEIGIRVALGATASQLIRMVVGGSLKIALIGVVVGLVLAIAAAQGMQALLFGVAPIDTVSFGAAALLLTGAAALAAFVPARHAIRANPSDVLRSQ
jgi:putative ABC transport system permease protein